MPLSDPQLRETISELIRRPGHDQVRVHVRNLLVMHLGAQSADVLFEHQVPEVRGRIDALIGRTVFEFKADLRKERNDAEEQLSRYLPDREKATGQRCLGVATDGADFIRYEFRKGKLVKLDEFKPLRGDIYGLPLWLRPCVAIAPEKSPDPETVRRELGRESVVYEIARSRIEDLWNEVKDRRDVILKRQLWSRLLQIVYGQSVDADDLFFQHTYLTIVAKTMATLMLGSKIPDAPELLSGKPFRDSGIEGVIESDFFDWILEADGSTELVRQIVGQVAVFRLGDIEHDVLKGLYESLIDPEQRHFLGEYYTPDWLAYRICEHVIDKPLKQRVLDPACGSGTFLFHAIRRFLEAAKKDGLSNRDALALCTDRVMGIDVHPVAVINARITYLLALGERRLADPGRSSLSIPVYLGDSLLWNTTGIINAQQITIEVPDGPELIFPVRVARDPSLFDAVLSEMLRLSEAGASPEALAVWIERSKREELTQNKDVIRRTYEKLRKLREDERNHIWGYMARNLSRPAWLASDGQRADVIVGNPPWLSYRYMSRTMQDRFKRESESLDMWAGGKVATHQDLSAYFFARSMDLYLRPRGKIAFVLPYATMSRKQYRGFIFREQNGEKGAVAVPVRRFTEGWLFDENVQPLFGVPSCVLFAENGNADSHQLPKKVTAFAGQLPERDASAAEADAHLTARLIPWPETAAEQTETPYGSRFRQGATIVPRKMFVVMRVPTGRFGTSSVAPAVETRPTTQAKRPWQDIKMNGQVEREFLRALYLGESVAPFRLLEPAEAVIPWDRKEGVLDSIAARKLGYTRVAEWLIKAEKLWNDRGAGRISLAERIDYFGNLTTQFPIAKIRVLYSASGTVAAAAILRDKVAIVEHKLYWISADSNAEAFYLVALLNSEAIRRRVSEHQSKGQWGARDFDKLLANALPAFAPSSSVHRQLVQGAMTAQKLAGKVEFKEGMHFIRIRQLVRRALMEDGIGGKIEALAEQALG